MNVRPAKPQISLGIRPVWSESSLCAQWIVKGPRFLHADSKDSDQTGWMPRLNWVFAGCTLTLLVFVMSRLICVSIMKNIHEFDLNLPCFHRSLCDEIRSVWGDVDEQSCCGVWRLCSLHGRSIRKKAYDHTRNGLRVSFESLHLKEMFV